MIHRFTSSIPNIKDEMYKNVIKKTFPNLNDYEAGMILKYFLRLIDIISYSFEIRLSTEIKLFLEKLRSEDYKDSKGILNLLLPFINSDSDKSKIYSMNDIYIKKYKMVNINEQEPKYEFSNIQYGRCIRNDNIEEILFEEEHLKQNFYLLINTIRNISKKLYVNWINVFPRLDDEVIMIYMKMNDKYLSLKEYVNNNRNNRNNNDYTTNLLNSIGDTMMIDMDDNVDDEYLVKDLYSLQFDDVYEVCSNFLYYEIKNIKWLIYDVYANDHIIPIIIYLKLYFGEIIDYAANGKNWLDINESLKLNFSNLWKMMIKGNININNILISDNENKKIIRSIIIFFDNYYKQKDKLIKLKKYISFNRGKDIDDEEEKLIYIPFQDILNSANSLDSSDVYDFIKESCEIFNNSFYSFYIYDNDNGFLKIKDLNNYTLSDLYHYTSEWNITGIKHPSLKNLYNFSKSLCHYTDLNNNYKELPRYWNSLTPKLKENILHRLCDSDNIDNWFNIKNNIRNIYNNLPFKYNLENVNLQICKVIQMNIILILHLVYSFKGLLSKVNFKLSSEVNFDSSSPVEEKNQNIIKYLKNNIYSNKKYQDSHYYLTNQPYKHCYTIYQNEKTKNTEYIKYFDFNQMKDQMWYKAYALDWISQINFFHKFLNNRIIYVTGSTGVGKSTQIPKLLLYAMKALSYNESGRLVCTQPRTTPTKNNALQVSKELGVPIEIPTISDNNRENYYVQYKYRGENKTKNVGHLSLRFVTDGSLNIELANPLLKKVIKGGYQNHDIFIQENMYDIVAVDEAHEHNTNMDMILTYMRYVAHYNNSIKLVIISATMDDDEPIYRRYYRNVNDNLMYPLNYNLKNYSIDRINVDRRLHISPPGQTTKFRIDEYYIENHLIKDPITIAMNIISKDPYGGDILLFRPGIGDILKDIKILNNLLPSNTIALPYYSQLNEKQKKIIEKIDQIKHLIKMNRNDDFNVVDPTIGNNKYTRVVIVATNIAEASITIKTLKYVIETGKQKTSQYNYQKRTSVLVEGNISESSRLQRKGRVGRVGSGTVYYTYPRGEMENNKTQYNISIQELGAELYRRLYESSSDIVLLNKKNDPNNPMFKITINTLKKNYEDNIDQIILKQYFILDDFFNYYGNVSQYDYNNYEPLANYYRTGFSLETLIDDNGKFYIIHPEELNIRRNINGKIMTLTQSARLNDVTLNNNIITSEKINSFWDTMINNLYVIYNKNYTFKTDFGKQMQQIQDYMEFENQKLFISYMYSRAYGIEEKMIRVICFLNSIGKYTDNFIITKNINGRFVRQINKVKQIVGEQTSDINAILNLLDKVHNILDIDTRIENKQNIVDLKKLKKYYDTNETIRKNINLLNGDKIMTLINSGTVDDIYDEMYKNKLISLFYKNIINIYQKENIELRCSELNINHEIIYLYFEKYFDFKNNVYNLENKLFDGKNDIDIIGVTNLLKEFMIDKTLINDSDKLTVSLLMGHPYNIIKNIHQTSFYLSIYSPSIDNVYSISKVGRSNIEDTLIDLIYTKGYLLYINSDIEKNTISILHHINPKLLKTISHIYNPEKITEKIYKYFKNMEQLQNNAQVIQHYKETLNEIQTDLSVHYDITTTNNTNKMVSFKKIEKEI